MSAKANALAAINKASAIVSEDGPVDGLRVRLILAALFHAEVSVRGIDELKRKRRVKKETA